MRILLDNSSTNVEKIKEYFSICPLFNIGLHLTLPCCGLVIIPKLLSIYLFQIKIILFYDILRTVYFYVRVVGITILSNFLVGKCIILGQQSFRQNQITDHNDTDTGFKHHCTINQTLKCKNYSEATIEPVNLLYTNAKTNCDICTPA